MLDLGFVAFAGFRTAAEYDNAQAVWSELPGEIRVQWRAAADAVVMYRANVIAAGGSAQPVPPIEPRPNPERAPEPTEPKVTDG